MEKEKQGKLPRYFAKSQILLLFFERKNDIIQVFSFRVIVP